MAVGIVGRIVNACQSYLADPGPVREAAAVCLARLLTRPDTDARRVDAFMRWSNDQLGQVMGAPASELGPGIPAESGDRDGVVGAGDGDGDEEGGGENVSSQAGFGGSGRGGGGGDDDDGDGDDGDGHGRGGPGAGGGVLTGRAEAQATGVLLVLVEVGKHGHRDVLCKHLPAVFEDVMRFAGSAVAASSTLLRKLTVKFATRVGLAYMPPRVVSWRYQRGKWPSCFTRDAKVCS